MDKKDKAATKFHPPADFPKKAIGYGEFIKPFKAAHPDMGGNDPKVLHAIVETAKKAEPLAATITKLEAELSVAKESYRTTVGEDFNSYMEQLEYARTYAKRHKNSDLEKGLERFKAHEGGHGKGGGGDSTGSGSK
ncbi:hypothetical protein HY251_04325 [bacterium]|nr:hypothetical protein [bacterium]